MIDTVRTGTHEYSQGLIESGDERELGTWEILQDIKKRNDAKWDRKYDRSERKNHTRTDIREMVRKVQQAGLQDVAPQMTPYASGAIGGLGAFLSYYYRNRREIHAKALVNCARGLKHSTDPAVVEKNDKILKALIKIRDMETISFNERPSDSYWNRNYLDSTPE